MWNKRSIIMSLIMALGWTVVSSLLAGAICAVVFCMAPVVADMADGLLSASLEQAPSVRHVASFAESIRLYFKITWYFVSVPWFCIAVFDGMPARLYNRFRQGQCKTDSVIDGWLATDRKHVIFGPWLRSGSNTNAYWYGKNITKIHK